MRINKKFIYTILGSIYFGYLFGFIYLVSGQTVKIEAPPGVPTSFVDLLTKIATGIGNLIAYIGTIMIIVAGILYLTSAGNVDRINTAKKALIYAIAGITIGLAANAIVTLITRDILGYTP